MGAPIYLLLVGALGGCSQENSYARLDIDVSLAHLTADQLALVRKITISSQPEGNSDPSRVYQYSMAVTSGDPKTDYQQDYLPSPQKGSFVVDVGLFGDNNTQLGLKSETIKLQAGKEVTAHFDFAPSDPTTTGFTTEGDAVELTSGSAGGDSFTMIWDTDHYLAIVTDLSVGKGDLFSMKLDAMGSPISTPIPINSSARVSTLPSIVKVDDQYVVAWQEGDKTDSPVAVQIATLDADGTRTGNIRQIPTSASEARPVLYGAFGAAVLAWSDDHGTPTTPQRSALVGLLDMTDLSLAAGGPVDLGAASGVGDGENTFPSIAMVGSDLRVSWVHADQTVYSATVDANLTLSPPTQLYTSTFTAQQLAVVAAGDALFTAWEDLSGPVDLGRERIRGVFSTPDGIGAGGIVHQVDTGSANWPRMAFGTEGNVAVVYYQYRDFGSQIYLTRYTPDGTRVDDADTQLTNVAGEAKYPDIRLGRTDSSGDHYAVGWTDNHTGVYRVYFQPIVCN